MYKCSKTKNKTKQVEKKNSISSTPIIISIISIYLKLITRTFFSHCCCLSLVMCFFSLHNRVACIRILFFVFFFCLCLCCERMYVTYMCVGHKQETNYEREYWSTLKQSHVSEVLCFLIWIV